MRIRDYDEADPLTKPRKSKPRKFRDPERKTRQKKHYMQNKEVRREYNMAMSSGDESRLRRATVPPSGLNKLGAGDKKTSGSKSGTPHYRGTQRHEQRND